MSELSFDLVGVHASSQALIDDLRLHPVDVVVVDYAVGTEKLAGASLIRAVRADHPTMPILIFSAQHDPVRVSLALRAGANGFVGKKQPMHELISAINQVASGATYVGTGVVPCPFLPVRHTP
jgi:DNA-binding NarL/FixJ family response regulator